MTPYPTTASHTRHTPPRVRLAAGELSVRYQCASVQRKRYAALYSCCEASCARGERTDTSHVSTLDDVSTLVFVLILEYNLFETGIGDPGNPTATPYDGQRQRAISIRTR